MDIFGPNNQASQRGASADAQYAVIIDGLRKRVSALEVENALLHAALKTRPRQRGLAKTEEERAERGRLSELVYKSRIEAALTKSPGSMVVETAVAAGLNGSACSRVLHKMEIEGLVEYRLTIRGGKCFYMKGQAPDTNPGDLALAMTKQNRSLRIIDFLTSHPGSSQRAIRIAVRGGSSEIPICLAEMVADGTLLLKEVSTGRARARTYSYYVVPKNAPETT